MPQGTGDRRLLRRLLWLVVEAGGGLGRKAAALARERVAAGKLPIAGGGAARKRLPAVGPIAQAVTVPGRLDVERVEVGFLPQSPPVSHIFPRRHTSHPH